MIVFKDLLWKLQALAQWWCKVLSGAGRRAIGILCGDHSIPFVRVRAYVPGRVGTLRS